MLLYFALEYATRKIKESQGLKFNKKYSRKNHLQNGVHYLLANHDDRQLDA
jgi:hypothetical protein